MVRGGSLINLEALFYLVAAVVVAFLVFEVVRMALSIISSRPLRYEPHDYGIGMMLTTGAVFVFFLTKF